MVRFLDIYETMLGLREPEACVPGIEDAFKEGSLCASAYDEMRQCYRRLCARLGDSEEDRDLDQMVACLEGIQKELCRRMFEMKIP